MKAQIKTEGFDDLLEQWKKKNETIDRACKRALLKSALETQAEINKASSGYVRTGAMIGDEIQPHLEQVNTMAYRCKVGFWHNEGGLHALLLNYGTPRKKKGKVVKGLRFMTNAIRRSARRRKDIMREQIIKDLNK
jgi:hypothetical protein